MFRKLLMCHACVSEADLVFQESLAFMYRVYFVIVRLIELVSYRVYLQTRKGSGASLNSGVITDLDLPKTLYKSVTSVSNCWSSPVQDAVPVSHHKDIT